jgi:sulfur carrier protein
MMLVNGEQVEWGPGDLAVFMAERGYGTDSRGVAVAVNGEVVPRAQWQGTGLEEQDRIELVEPVQGG